MTIAENALVSYGTKSLNYKVKAIFDKETACESYLKNWEYLSLFISNPTQ
ncbi:hypothetical protein SAMN05443633_102257 [Chryseobacterium arachidis]|uniref:Uncharacterized protein n=1 Tax=Chryseobacterium arachidis TaxID=1416778 RepID=A0A1M4X8E9_9FLAO|nr:hypothetical protein [Chryseobacterium arachidis]SHE89701.1 hypothetical protein SAMN05443633_102257 [Chryseobacterium arachidis]